MPNGPSQRAPPRFNFAGLSFDWNQGLSKFIQQRFRLLELVKKLPPQIAPACHPVDTDSDNRVFFKRHRLHLRVPVSQQLLCRRVFRPCTKDLGVAADHHPTQPGPILIVVSIRNERHGRVFSNITEALERGAISLLRFVVYGDVNPIPGNGEAHRHDVRPAVGISRRQVGDALGLQKPAVVIGQGGERNGGA